MMGHRPQYGPLYAHCNNPVRYLSYSPPSRVAVQVTTQSHLWFPTLNSCFYTNTMLVYSKLVCGNKCAQVLTDGSGYNLLFYPMKKESDTSKALNKFIFLVGVPKELVSDGAWVETQGKFGKVVKEYWIKHQHITKPHSPWQNGAASAICEIKHSIWWATLHTKSPKWLWDYCGKWVSFIWQLTHCPLHPFLGW